MAGGKVVGAGGALQRGKTPERRGGSMTPDGGGLDRTGSRSGGAQEAAAGGLQAGAPRG
ncbi:MAG: hypothetical protein QME89_06840 [Actinomycetota bacterium]|nr:hypothetical protein [Actinomycetota bacterium]